MKIFFLWAMDWLNNTKPPRMVCTRNTLGVLMGILICSGCTISKPTDPYVGTTVYRHPPATVANDSQSMSIVTRGPLSLQEAIHIARANNPDLAAAQYEASASGVQRDIAEGQRLPSLHIIAGYNHYRNSRRLLAATENSEPGVFSKDMFASDMVLTMPLFTGGRITSEIKASELLLIAAKHNLARTEDELVFNISSVFYTILAQRQVIDSLTFSQTTLQEHLRRIQELIHAKKAARVDLLRTEVRVADLEQQLVQERNILAIQIRLFTKLLGLNRFETSVEPSGELYFDKTVIPETEQALEQALKNRVDYLAARAALEAQARVVDGVSAGRYPSVLLTGAYGGRWSAHATDNPTGTDTDIDEGQVGVMVDIPIFEGGRIDGRIRLEMAHLKAAQERLRRLELQVELEVETAILNLEAAINREEATGKAIEQAQESLRIERQKYELGKGSIIDVLDAQTAQLDAQTNYSRTLADCKIFMAQYRLTVGDRE
jgi:outer membrane protein TolC